MRTLFRFPILLLFLVFSTSALGMTVKLSLSDNSSDQLLEQNAPSVTAQINLNFIGEGSVDSMTKFTVFLAGSDAKIDEDYEVDSVKAIVNGQIVTIPNQADVANTEISWGADSNGIWINNWTSSYKDPFITIRLKADRFFEGNETISFAVTNDSATGVSDGDSVDIGSPSSRDVTIVDDETSAEIVVTNSGPEIVLETLEDDGTATFNISLTSEPYPDGTTVTIPLTKDPRGVDPDPITGQLLVDNSEVTQVVLNKDNFEAGITVTIKSGGGTIIDPNENYTVVTGDPASSDPNFGDLTAADVGDVKVTDKDNEAGTVIQIDSGFLTYPSEPAIVEGATLNIPVQRICSGDCSTDTVSVLWRTIEGPGVNDAKDADFDPNSGNNPAQKIEWLNGNDDAQNIQITITPDDLQENDEPFSVELYDAVVGSINEAQKTSAIIIPANDIKVPGTITVSDVQVNEVDGGKATLTITRSGGSDGKIVLDWATADGDSATATENAVTTGISDDGELDYTTKSGKLTWDNEEASIDIEIDIDNDIKSEPDEFFRVVFTLNTDENETDEDLHGFTEFDGQANVTILANDAADNRGTIVITNAATVNEGNTDGTVTVTFNVNRALGVDGPVHVEWTTADVTAIDGVDDGVDPVPDYVASTGTLAWAENTNEEQFIEVSIKSDTISETPTLESFNVQLTVLEEVFPDGDNAGEPVCDGLNDDDPDWCALPAPTVDYPEGQDGFAKADINDDDAPGEIVLLNAIPVTVGEGAGNLVLTLERQSGTQGTISLNYATADGDSATATDNAVTTGTSEDGLADYTPKTDDLVWDSPEGSQIKQITIAIDDDSLVEDPQSFLVNLSLNEGSTIPSKLLGVDDATDSVINVTIVDNDNPDAVVISVPSSRFVSESSSSVTITLERSTTTGVSWVNYTTMATNPEDAVAGEQYSAKSGQLQFEEGDKFKSATINILEDDNDDDQKFLVVFSQNGENNDYTFENSISTTEVTILDVVENEPGDIIISKVDTEEGGIAKVLLTRANGSNGLVSVDWTMEDLDAKSTGGANTCDVDENSGNDNDYTRIPSGTVTWQDKEAGEKEILITTLEDLCIENTEDFKLTFELADGSADADLSTELVTVNIFDNDGGGTFRISDNTVMENEDNPQLLVVERIGGTQGFVYMEYNSFDGTAVANNDYYQFSGALTWSDGDSTPRYLTTEIRPDRQEELPETFTVVLSNVDAERPVELLKAVGVVTILDPFAVPTLSQWSLMILLLMTGWIGYRNLLTRKVKLN